MCFMNKLKCRDRFTFVTVLVFDELRFILLCKQGSDSLTQYEKSCGKHVKIYKYINKQLTYKILHILHLAICLNNELIEVFILLCKKCDVYLNKDKIEICL